MQKLLTLIVFLFVSGLGFSQSTPIEVPKTQIEVPQTQINISVSDLPEMLKGEIPPNFRTDMLAELLEMKAITTRVGELHPTILDNPRILAIAIQESSAVDAAFREYITTGNDSMRETREEELLDIY